MWALGGTGQGHVVLLKLSQGEEDRGPSSTVTL